MKNHIGALTCLLGCRQEAPKEPQASFVILPTGSALSDDATVAVVGVVLGVMSATRGGPSVRACGADSATDPAYTWPSNGRTGP